MYVVIFFKEFPMDIKKNDVINIDITDISSDGNGVGKKDGFAIFVPMTDIGDNIDAMKR